MEVTLAQHRSQNEPDKADFLAQFNQRGSGTLEEKALTTSPNESEFQDTAVKKTTPRPQPGPASAAEPAEKPVVTTTASHPHNANRSNRAERTVDTEVDIPQKTLLQRSLEIASLQARLDRKRQAYARRPRIKRLTSLSTMSSADAYYLHSWRRKIERIGNLNYPAEASRRNIYGELRLMVAVLPDGSLKEVELLESSGYKVLDDAAVRIVKLASPFAPFPDQLRETTDVLEIIRTWQFRKNSSLKF